MLLSDAGFTHLFLILSWNLMCRSSSTASVRIAHFTDEGDALGVTFFKSKTDLGGTKRRDPKQLYANPMQPVVLHSGSGHVPGLQLRTRLRETLSWTLPA
ncbi:hypothetical protein H310_00675 [Aphanomyces invadans]|uniref:Secreted protein n=1 Tax=Aphanomyces invadans TaxID=157072 RepID=A0A024UWN7_9STRA|nr:hypothetical protein H310_00675 [Aphanomyces invadans]ETW10352.1 hypothetical protein H310_00675 [Aphanomyces invadans]|eukprot:XP_008861763.1 hypothetical protein H310_00675 [Aphanomyces invadans]